jgi:hypothetical protein
VSTGGTGSSSGKDQHSAEKASLQGMLPRQGRISRVTVLPDSSSNHSIHHSSSMLGVES